jgi:hypothetical protein
LHILYLFIFCIESIHIIYIDPDAVHIHAHVNLYNPSSDLITVNQKIMTTYYVGDFDKPGQDGEVLIWRNCS